MADIDKNPATLLAELAALDPPQRRDVAVAVALMSASTLASTARPRPNRSSLSTTAPAPGCPAASNAGCLRTDER